MERLQAFKFELRPNGEQQRQMRCFAGSCRRVFNDALDLQIKNHKNGGKFSWHISKDNRKTQANFACVECGFEENADLVGAFNVLAAGHAVLACGEAVQLGPSVKQEPTEVIQAAA